MTRKNSRLLGTLTAVLLTAGTAVGLAAAPALAATCTLTGPPATCGPYSDASIPMANSFNTYIVDQSVGANAGDSNTLNATDPGNWSLTANEVPYGYTGVQTFDNVQQLTNDWNGSGWGSGSQDTPLSALSALKVNYTESSPSDANSISEFAPDVWNDSYGSDVMFWADTNGRCNTGSYGGTILGTATFDNQTWTVNRYGGAGAEIIFVLDSNPAVANSCAHQTSGSINVLAGYQWLVANGYMSTLGALSQLNTGWEITSADNTTFTMSSYSITATIGAGGGGQQAPAVTTTAASGISTSAATLNGTVNPEGAATTYQFSYGTTTAYGTNIPATPASAGAGTTSAAESASLTGLSPGTTYHDKLCATNSGGTTCGLDQTFTTQQVAPSGNSIWYPSAPTGALAINDNASVNLGVKFQANQNGTIGAVWFNKAVGDTGTHQGALWDSTGTKLASGTFTGETASGWQELVFTTAVSITAGQTYTASYLSPTGQYEDTGAGLATAVTNGPLTALAGGGVYTYASTLSYPTSTFNNSNYWVDVVFTPATQTAPVVTTNAATGVTASGATLNGSVNPEGAATTYKFDYGTTTSYGSSVPSPAASAGSGTTAVSESANLTGLTASTVYHYRVEATNSGGTSFGADQTFTTSAAAQAPVVTTNAATSVTTSGATLNGSVNPNGQATTYQFQYGTTTSYGTNVPTTAASAGSGTTAVNESATLTGLAASTVYHYRITATNATGTSNGTDQTFTTSAAPSLLLGDNAIEASADNNLQGQAQAVQFTAVKTGTSLTFSFYVDSTSTATAADIGLYSNSGTDPGSLLKQVSFTPVAGQWNSVTFSGVSITSGTKYWEAELGTAGTLVFRDQGAGAYTPGSSQANLTVLPATWTTGHAWHSGLMSGYVTG